jgi:hypothetical protein
MTFQGAEFGRVIGYSQLFIKTSSTGSETEYISFVVKKLMQPNRLESSTTVVIVT